MGVAACWDAYAIHILWSVRMCRSMIHCKKHQSSQSGLLVRKIGKHKVSNNRYSKFKNCLRTKSFFWIP